MICFNQEEDGLTQMKDNLSKSEQLTVGMVRHILPASLASFKV